jgi:hypothetical protein
VSALAKSAKRLSLGVNQRQTGHPPKRVSPEKNCKHTVAEAVPSARTVNVRALVRDRGKLPPRSLAEQRPSKPVSTQAEPSQLSVHKSCPSLSFS